MFKIINGQHHNASLRSSPFPLFRQPVDGTDANETMGKDGEQNELQRRSYAPPIAGNVAPRTLC